MINFHRNKNMINDKGVKHDTEESKEDCYHGSISTCGGSKTAVFRPAAHEGRVDLS